MDLSDDEQVRLKELVDRKLPPMVEGQLKATFQRLIDRVIGPELRPHAFCYLDDIIVVTEKFEEHLKWLATVLDKITKANLTVNPEKCEFCRSEVKYLGYVVNKEGLSVNPEKTEPILTYLAPKNIK